MRIVRVCFCCCTNIVYLYLSSSSNTDRVEEGKMTNEHCTYQTRIPTYYYVISVSFPCHEAFRRFYWFTMPLHMYANVLSHALNIGSLSPSVCVFGWYDYFWCFFFCCRYFLSFFLCVCCEYWCCCCCCAPSIFIVHTIKMPFGNNRRRIKLLVFI